MRIRPQFEDANLTTVIGEPGGTVTLDCNIFMLQDHTVSGLFDDKGLVLFLVKNNCEDFLFVIAFAYVYVGWRKYNIGHTSNLIGFDK